MEQPSVFIGSDPRGSMTTYRIFQNAPFDPEYIDLMSFVFDQVSIELGLARSTDALRDLVAKAILECAQKGIRDPVEMRRCAHKVLQSA
jgi:hypothetical protein